MKLQIFSDIHVEFGTKLWDHVTPQAPVAVVPGDINARNFVLTLNDIATKFEHVVALPGNHDFYGKDISWLDTRPADLAKNVHVLNPGLVEIEDVTFIGAVLWSDCKKEDWFATNAAQSGVNDFRAILNGSHYSPDGYRSGDKKFNVKAMIDRHYKEVAYLKLAFEMNRGKKIVALTHFLPSFALVHPKYGTTDMLNYYFAASCDDLVMDSEATLWVCGHTHDPRDVMVGDVRVVCNPLGYPSEYQHQNYEDLIIEV